ncbi:DUF1488 domain-containing protein [Robbsia sp. Bb-Pol-6]|uniref:DUF1488 domain-containing protein n=1 Tax=Robbsia betulipollinis TaxID=2981849 RepID=A0ABT3ZN71_9BURK|nr:DUF1488 domain-containing protein [Robbsia betulipollinis]MCY0387998.1 DUF1488 domain-containing protein [Robbsia betulipollinis]
MNRHTTASSAASSVANSAVSFENVPARYRADNLTVVFPARVGEHDVECAISVEALEDHFSVASTDEAGWLAAFARSRAAIEDRARHHLLLDAGRPVLLKSGHFHPQAPSVDVPASRMPPEV